MEHGAIVVITWDHYEDREGDPDTMTWEQKLIRSFEEHLESMPSGHIEKFETDYALDGHYLGSQRGHGVYVVTGAIQAYEYGIPPSYQTKILHNS